MNPISTQPYIQIERKIDGLQQNIHQTIHYLYLFENEVHTSSQKFNLKDIFDMSFKSINLDTGFLYLHTHQGIFSFQVEDHPLHFMDEYKKLQKKKEQ
ncbi:hypothetical protein LCL95_15605 [Bacillus timonensis]|nr:hypothetical protein [Bacillus timonensis]